MSRWGFQLTPSKLASTSGPTRFLLCFAVGAGVIQAHDGLRARLFTKPLTTWQIQLWLAIVPAALMVLVHLLATAAIRWLYGADWPWVRPAATMAIAVLLFKAAYWRLVVGSAVQLVAVLGVTFALVFGLTRVYQPQGLSDAVLLNPPFSVAEVVVMVGTALVSLLVGFDALKKERVGAISAMSCTAVANRIELWLRDRSNRMRDGGASAEEAITQFLWREGMVMPVLASLLFGALPLGIGGVQWQQANYHRMLELALNLPWVMGIACGALLGSSVGMCIRRPGQKNALSMSTFTATKPLSDQQLWRAVRKVVLQGTFVVGLMVLFWCWLIPILACATGSADVIAAEFNRAELVQRFGWAAIGGSIGSSFVVLWSTATLFAGCLFLGRDHQLAIPLAAFAVCVLLHFVAVAALPSHFVLIFDMFLWCGAALLAMGAVAVVYVLAHQRQLVDWRHVTVSSIIVAVVFLLLPEYHVWALGGAVMIASALVVGIPLAPLGLSLSRHR